MMAATQPAPPAIPAAIPAVKKVVRSIMLKGFTMKVDIKNTMYETAPQGFLGGGVCGM